MLVMVHAGRPQALESARLVIGRLCKAGITVRVTDAEAEALGCPGTMVVPASVAAADGAELVIVLGGDGSLLRAAEFARPARTPLIGVNLGHVGFLAEAEVDGLAATVDKLIEGKYAVEERMTVDVVARASGMEFARTWALNEATVEKGARERMVEVVIEIDGRPLSRWGCDGVVCATPTGSTAYAFSAGGPVVWPGVEALLMVPISPHALFAPPMMVSPESVIAVELLYEGPRGGTRAEGDPLAARSGPAGEAGGGEKDAADKKDPADETSFAGEIGDPSGTRSAVMWCDGRRKVELPPGARVEVRRGSLPVLLARIHGVDLSSGGEFTDRLVAKFGLPVAGWRGRSTHGG
jgi:NAD+ kinase